MDSSTCLFVRLFGTLGFSLFSYMFALSSLDSFWGGCTGGGGFPGRKYVVLSSQVLPSLECYTKAARMSGNTITAPYGKSVKRIPNKSEQHSGATSDLQSNISVRLLVTNLLRAAWQVSRCFALHTLHNNAFSVEIVYLNAIMQQRLDEAISCHTVI